MATTIGIKLYVGSTGSSDAPATGMTSTVAESILSTGTQIKGVYNIPELQGPPNTIDTSSIEDDEQVVEPGQIQTSALNIVMNYKEGVYSAGTEDQSNFEQCVALEGLVYGFVIKLPNGRYFAFYAKAVTTTSGMGVAAPLQFGFNLYKRSKVYRGYQSSTTAAAGEEETPAEQGEEQNGQS